MQPEEPLFSLAFDIIIAQVDNKLSRLQCGKKYLFSKAGVIFDDEKLVKFYSNIIHR